jgi:hypothetical protein
MEFSDADNMYRGVLENTTDSVICNVRIVMVSPAGEIIRGSNPKSIGPGAKTTVQLSFETGKDYNWELNLLTTPCLK